MVLPFTLWSLLGAQDEIEEGLLLLQSPSRSSHPLGNSARLPSVR